MELPGAESFPRFAKIKRNFPDLSIKDIDGAVREAMQRSGIAGGIRPKSNIAITAGSRGIKNIVEVLRAAGDFVRERGANPFIVPAMGSHGGATAPGQKALLAELGISENTVGMPVRSNMETVEIGHTVGGTPVFTDRIAFDSDGIIAVNRVKPHTSLVGALGSGICKMLAVGLGKEPGASAFHRLGPIELEKILPEMARIVIEKAPIIGGVGLVEDAWDNLSIVKGALPRDILRVDEELVNEACRLMPRLPFDELDVLVFEEMGKDISGTGMDANVIGRRGIRLVPDIPTPRIRRIVVLGLSAHSQGNAHGIGLADIVTERLAKAIDWAVTRENALASSFPEKGMLPLAFPTDREAIAAALMTAWVADTRRARMVITRNTLALDKLYISESLLEKAIEKDGIEKEGDLIPLKFNENGLLISKW